MVNQYAYRSNELPQFCDFRLEHWAAQAATTGDKS